MSRFVALREGDREQGEEREVTILDNAVSGETLLVTSGPSGD